MAQGTFRGLDGTGDEERHPQKCHEDGGKKSGLEEGLPPGCEAFFNELLWYEPTRECERGSDHEDDEKNGTGGNQKRPVQKHKGGREQERRRNQPMKERHPPVGAFVIICFVTEACG